MCLTHRVDIFKASQKRFTQAFIDSSIALEKVIEHYWDFFIRR